MTTSSDARNPVEALAEEFLDRKRHGEQPTLREYVERYPELADDIRDLFPALLMMEDLGESSGGTTGSLAAGNSAAVGVRLQRLGDYRILREIGRGGMGVVYEAEQESLGRRVALKVLSASALLDPKQVRRFEREAKAAAKLHHTNIVPVFGVGRQDGHHYFVMQFIAGLGLDVVLDDLRRLRGGKSEAKPVSAANRVACLTGADVARSLLTGRFDADGPPEDGSVTEPFEDAAPPAANGPPADSGVSSALLPGSSELSSSDPDRQFYRSVARIGVQVAEALEYANRQGILHRDVKPSNLLLDNHGNVWVADFGLAKTAEADDLTHTGDILGTIRYMAPERFSGHCDARSDVYSLGLTLYELVALRPAYEAADRHTLMDRVLHEEPERLKKRAPGVPRDLETIIAKAISRDPATRYVTAAALADDLRRFVDDRPIQARRISPAERLARWCKRNKVLASSLGVAAFALVAMAAMSLLYADRQRRHASELAAAQGYSARLAGKYKDALDESNRRMARLDLGRARTAFEKDQIDVGMLWLVESLKAATEAGDAFARRAALANLSAWRQHLVGVKHVFHHSKSVLEVAFSPDGKMIATASWDKTARVWDLATGQPIGPPITHRDAVRSVAFSPDGHWLATASNDGTARIWDVASGRPIGPVLEHAGFVFCIAFSPDGRRVVTGCADRGVRVWDALTGARVGQPMLHDDLVFDAAYSPDGKLILTGSWDKTARLWDAASGTPVGHPLVHPGFVYCVAFSPDGKILATGGADSQARLWDSATGSSIGQPIAHSGSVWDVAFSPDGRTLVTGSSDGKAQFWDVATGRRTGRTLEHQGTIYSVAFSPDGNWVLTGGMDATARLSNWRAGQVVGRELDIGDLPRLAVLSRDGQSVLGARDDSIGRWDVATGQLQRRILDWPAVLTCLAMSPDDKVLATGGMGTARLWSIATGQPIGQPMSHGETVTSVAFSPDGKTLATVSKYRTVRTWDVATGQPIGQPMSGHSDYVMAVAFSPDGQRIATGSWDHTARLWDVTGQPIGQPMTHLGPVCCVAFSPDGKSLLSGGWDTTARLWNARTGESLGSPLEHPSEVHSAAFSPDGTLIATRTRDGSACLWDAATGQPVGPPSAPEDRPRRAAAVFAPDRVFFRPDGRLFSLGPERSQLLDLPVPVPDDLPRLSAWVESATGLKLDTLGSIHPLDRDAWQQARTRLERLGGEPPAGPVNLRDPILFGPDPTARARAWMEQKRWAEAEAAFDEAVVARPFNTAILLERARFLVAHSQGQKADDDFARAYILGNRKRPLLDTISASESLFRRVVEESASSAAPLWDNRGESLAKKQLWTEAGRAFGEAVRLQPDNLAYRHPQILALLAAGDHTGLRRARTDMLDRFRMTRDYWVANDVAWWSVLAAGEEPNLSATVRLAELAVNGIPENGNILNTLGAALYRAGRFAEAVRRLDEAIQKKRGVSTEADWVFLAMAHHRLGHQDVARRWLDRFRDRRPNLDPSAFWNELEIRLLRAEAEAVVLWDPIFPADPFAP